MKVYAQNQIDKDGTYPKTCLYIKTSGFRNQCSRVSRRRAVVVVVNHISKCISIMTITGNRGDGGVRDGCDLLINGHEHLGVCGCGNGHSVYIYYTKTRPFTTNSFPTQYTHPPVHQSTHPQPSATNRLQQRV